MQFNAVGVKPDHLVLIDSLKKDLLFLVELDAAASRIWITKGNKVDGSHGCALYNCVF